MPELDTRKRRELRDSAFAYVDSQGRRRLPIHDESHVRNALARFNQVRFEDEAARATARSRLLRAAKRFGIVPIGFIDGQLRAHTGPPLPTGTVTLLMTDVVDSTGLVQRLGDRYAPMLGELRRLMRTTVQRAGGVEVDARGDEYFAAFASPASAFAAVVAIQRAVADHDWPDGVAVSVRAGLHTGRPSTAEGGYVGIAVHAVQRICATAGGGQVIASRAAVQAVGDALPKGARLADLGEHRLKGLPAAERLYELTGGTR